ncbi:MAG: Ppx/GppA family phosphatase [Rhodobacterales bacterium]|nr:Ppx/GppA family phosphatase [Rhodobacterales bacterium]
MTTVATQAGVATQASVAAHSRAQSQAHNGEGRVAVVDIGSNTVRLVVYDVPSVLPIPMFNEKVQCQLGRHLGETGKLYPEGRDEALRSLARFACLARAMGVERLDLVATAAVREAEDGPAFVDEVRRDLNLDINVISGEEEARLAAMGLLSGVPHADGLLGDIGGGSLDLVVLNNGEFGPHTTLPLGHLRLAELADGNMRRTAKAVDKHLSGMPWLSDIADRTFYAVGGVWRAVARAFIELTDYPLHVIDGYTLPRDEALKLIDRIMGMDMEALVALPSVSRRRTETLPHAALAMGRLLEAAKPRQLTFSGFGMREGRMITGLPQDLRRKDPLISGCITINDRTGRFAIRGDEILDWMAPLFPGETAAERRLRLAACLLSDIGWIEHPDYRGVHAFNRALRLPFAGLTHTDRVVLGLSVWVRYNGDLNAERVRPMAALLDATRLERVNVVGLALRLAHTVSGSAPGLLPQTRLAVEDGTLVLHLPETGQTVFRSAAVERRLKTLGRALGLNGKLG